MADFMMESDSSPVPNFAGMVRLDGKGFVVLGAGQGIGRQVCHALAQAGATPLCVDVDTNIAGKIADETNGIPCVADITKRTDMQKVFELAQDKLAQPGGIVDIVGRAEIGPISALTDETYEEQHDVVFRHAWLAIQIGAPWLAAAGGGSIVLVGSISGVIPSPNQAFYGSQKAAVHHLARAAAVEYGPNGVRVNTVAPGITRTARLMELVGDNWPAVEATIPLRRAADPADIARVVLFLCTPLARHVTAQTIVVDGGTSSTVMRPPFQATKNV